MSNFNFNFFFCVCLFMGLVYVVWVHSAFLRRFFLTFQKRMTGRRRAGGRDNRQVGRLVGRRKIGRLEGEWIRDFEANKHQYHQQCCISTYSPIQMTAVQISTKNHSHSSPNTMGFLWTKSTTINIGGVCRHVKASTCAQQATSH